jgi:hypothetical protein
VYARLTRFPLKPDSAEQVVPFGAKYEKILHDLPGHRSTVMFIQDSTLVSFTTRDSEEHAQAATAAASGPAQQELAEFLTGAPTTTIGEATVYDLRH